MESNIRKLNIKTNMKKFIRSLFVTTGIGIMSTSVLLFCTSSCAFAEKVKAADHYIKSDFDIKLNAYANFQSGFRNQSNLSKDEKNVSSNRNGFAFYNDAAFFLEASKPVDDATYGCKIVLVPTAKKKGGSFNGTHIFVETSYGKIEFGSPINAGSNMYIDGTFIAAATGDNWTNYAKFDSEHLKQGKSIPPSFMAYSDFFLDSRLVTNVEKLSYSTEPSRGISYYTPKFQLGSATNLQLGISYIPDSSNTGADSATASSSGVNVIKIDTDGVPTTEEYTLDISVKDAFAGGITLEQNFADGVDLKLAFTGEYGKSAGGFTSKSGDKKYSLKDLRAYNIGGILNVANFSVAGSYGSLGKSLTTPAFHKTGQETRYYTGAIAYKYGPFNTSISYYNSTQYKNTVDAITLGTDFKLAPGLLPYAEISGFTLKGKPEFYPELKKKKTRGTVAIIGMKLNL